MALGNDPEMVRDQYANESRLATRSSVWRPTVDGRTPQDVAAAAIAEAHPARLLEVGCGTGAFAERLAAENPNCSIVATDLVVAMWMPYHLPDLNLGLAEVRRVLRPGGTFVAATNGDGHLAEILVEAGSR